MHGRRFVREDTPSFDDKEKALPIAKPPFYAVRMQGYYLLDTAGLAVDSTLRVVTHG